MQSARYGRGWQQVSDSRNSRGEVINGFEHGLDDIKEWTPTVAAIRDAALDYRCTMIDWGGGSLKGFLPEAREFVPNQSEVEKVSTLCHEAVTAGRLIDLGNLPNDVIQDCGHRAGPLWNQHALGWPFHEPWIFCHSWEGGVCVYLINPGEMSFEVCELRPYVVSGVGTLSVTDRGAFEKSPQHDRYQCTLAPSMLHFVRDPELARMINNGSTPWAAAASNLADPVMCALLILNTRNIERTTIAASEKLQRARAKSGKARIPSHDVVNTVPYVTAIRMRKEKHERVDHGGHHASPVYHLRMGHPRTYTSGRTIFISDTLVNATEEQRANFKSTRSHYAVRP